MRWPGLATTVLGMLAGTLALAGSASGSPSHHGPAVWSGQWKTSTGAVGFRRMNDEEIESAQTEPEADALFNQLPCKQGPDFYRGGYTAGKDTGKVIACGSADRLRGRWLSYTNSADQGSFDIRLGSATTYTGKALSDTSETPFEYKGTFKTHFSGDRCCDPELTIASGRLDIAMVQKLFAPRVIRIRAGTILRFCNRQPFIERPFSYSKHNEFGAQARIHKRNDPDSILLMSGECWTYTVKNPTNEPIVLKVFSEVHSQMKAVYMILPAS